MKQKEILITAGLDVNSFLNRIIIKDKRDIEKTELAGKIIDIHEEEWEYSKGVKYLVLYTDLGYEIKLTFPTSGGKS